jgi:hypothetical protein
MASYIGNAPTNGEFKKLDSIQSLFNGALTEFDLEFSSISQSVGDPTQLIVSLNGVVQEPGAAYILGFGGNSIIFSTAPASTDQCYIALFGGIGGTATPTDGSVTSAKIAVQTGDVSFADNAKATFGAGNDLQIYHDGSHSYIRDAGAGDLRLRGDGYVYIQSQTSGGSLAHFHADAEVTLYHNNAAKLATTSNGIDVTGAVTAETQRVERSAYPFIELQQTGSTGIGQVAMNGDNLEIRQTQAFNMSLYTNNLERLRIDSTGNVSVGVGNSKEPLIQFTNSGRVASNPGYSFRNDVGTGMFNPNLNNTIAFATGGTEKVRINSAGSVGIGTISPSSLFHVKGGANTTARIEPNNNSGKATLLLSSTGSGDGGIQYDANNNQAHLFSYSDMTFGVGSGNLSGVYPANERMRIDSAGNVFVGKTASDTNAAGHELKPHGVAVHTTDGISALYLNRKSTDGDLAIFRKDNTTVGSIGTYNGVPYIGYAGGAGGGIMFNGLSIEPTALGSSRTNGNNDIGSTSYRWKDLHLSGSVNGKLASATAAMVTATPTSASAQTIISTNNAFIDWNIKTTSNSSWYSISGANFTILKSGLVSLNFNQDIITVGATGYAQCGIYINGAVVSQQLITNTDTQWDCIHNAWCGYLNVNDYISVKIQASSISSLDVGSWSNYQLMWIAQ